MKGRISFLYLFDNRQPCTFEPSSTELNIMQSTYPDQSSDMRDNNTSTRGQWDDPMGGNQGKWEHREGERHQGASTATRAIILPVFNAQRSSGLLLITLSSLDNTGSMDTRYPQNLGQSGYEYSTSQDATGPGGIAVQSERYPSTGQQGGPGMATIGGQTGGYVDRQPEDDEYHRAVGAGGDTGKPSMTSRVKGTSSPSVLWSRTLAQTDVRVVGF